MTQENRVGVFVEGNQSANNIRIESGPTEWFFISPGKKAPPPRNTNGRTVIDR